MRQMTCDDAAADDAAAADAAADDHSDVVVAAFYLFTPLPRLVQLKAFLQVQGGEASVQGLVLLATEGINGTVAGTRLGVDAFLTSMRSLPELARLTHKESYSDRKLFHRLKIQIKPEIVTFKQPSANPAVAVGAYVEPREWNALIAAPDVIVVDVRNDFEVKIGTFAGAINPATTSFTQFAAFVDANLGAHREQKVALFCTGGIRCEKASSYLMAQGFKNVVHLSGGILKYLEEVPAAESRWQGECFVFDQRVTVGQQLAQGKWRLCHACYQPLDPEAQAAPAYEVGVSCPGCVGTFDDVKLRSLRERQHQMLLAERRHEPHMGKAMPPRPKP